jgi:hypothetical protein
MQPITGPIRHISGRLDAATGRFVPSPESSVGSGGLTNVYDNTCLTGAYVSLDPRIGSATHAEAAGDWGAIPARSFTGDTFCTPGCADDYNIRSFQIGYCLRADPVGGTTIEIDFWDTPQQSCVLGTAPGNNPFGGSYPPTTPTAHSLTLNGLPSPMGGTLTCYVLNVDTEFTLSGSENFFWGFVPGDKFAWSMSIPTSTGADGPIAAGRIHFTSPCRPCAGSLWEVTGQTTSFGLGTGAGQDAHFFQEDFVAGPTSTSADCYSFGGTAPPTGLHMRLFAEDPCTEASSFCDGTDGSLTTCPCGNPGATFTGCNHAQGGGGVGLHIEAQETVPMNRATLTGNGFPVGTTPAAVAIRSATLDSSGGAVFGDGVRCVASPFVRVRAAFAIGGTATYEFGHGGGAGRFYYQLWYRSQPASFCTPDAFNASGGRLLDW